MRRVDRTAQADDVSKGEIVCERDGARGLYTVGRGSHPLGFLAVDSMVAGRSRGGLRFVPDVTAEELKAAARTMTLKYGFLGLPQGGAKAGVFGDPDGPGEDKRERLNAFARAAEPLLRERTYTPDTDLGTQVDDIRSMMQAIGHPIGPRDWRHNQSGHYTAVSCGSAARALLHHVGGSLSGCQVAIEGFGQVGSALAALLHGQGARVVAVSTSRGALYHPPGLDVPRLLRLATEAGSAMVERYPAAERLDRAALLELPVDLLCPCARYHSIRVGNAERVAARVVCAGANDPVEAEAEGVLHRRGIVYAPDFISNSGGVLGGTLEFAGVRPRRIASIIERHTARSVAALLEVAAREAVPPRALAEPLALARHERVRLAAEHPRFRDRALAVGLEWYRRGWLPKAVVGSIAPMFLERRLQP
jgi:glutamate dehydrogenase (NAD(P)+)